MTLFALFGGKSKKLCQINKIFQQKLIFGHFSWSKIPESEFDKEPYGLEFATKIANFLKKKGSLILNEHRDYCGVGFEFSKGTYIFGHVYDGTLLEKIKIFEKKGKFVEWMRNNQRIYKKDLLKFIEEGIKT